MSKRCATLVCVLLLWCGVTGSAAAQSVVVVAAPADDARVQRSAASRAAVQALVDALTMQGLRVVDFDAAVRKLADARSCQARDCAERLLRERAVDMTAEVALWSDESSDVARAEVVLTDAERNRYQGAVAVEANDVRGATTRALLEARALQLLGPGPWLRVDGTPDGAEVRIDGRAVGALPYRGTIASGRHALRIAAQGYRPVERTLDVPDGEPGQTKLEVELEPLPIETADASEHGGRRDGDARAEAQSAAWVVWPIALGGAGVVLAATTTARLLSGRDACVGADAAGRCTEERRTNVGASAVYYSLSAALVGTAVVWLVLGADGDEAPLRAGVSPTGVSLAGGF